MSNKQTRPILDIAKAPMYQHIGEVTAYFALLEQEVGRSAGRLLFRDQRAERHTGAVVTAELSFRARLALLASAYHVRLPRSDYSALNDVCARLEKIEEERNKVIHATWSMHEGEIYRLKLTAKRKGPRFTKELVTPDSLIEIRERIASITAELEDFVVNALHEIAAGAGDGR
jgi:hypothetical protein